MSSSADLSQATRRMSRRTVIRNGAALAITAAFPGPASSTDAPAHRFKLGAAEITVISDGHMLMPFRAVLPTTEQAEVGRVLAGRIDNPDAFKAEVNVVVVRTPGALIVVDSGGTSDFMPTMGAFAERMERAGIKADEVTHVIFTHAHADHLWGVIDPLDDDTRFANARHILTAAERDYWLQTDLEAKVPDTVKGMAIGTARRLKMLSKRLETVAPNSEIVPGVKIVDTAGHTPGHVAVQLQFDGNSMMIVGDALANSIVSFERPDWPWGSDVDRDLAIKTRRRLLDQLATDRIPLLGYHLPWPGLGRVERKDTAYRLIAG